MERAADWIFSHADELDQPDEVPMETQEAAGQQAQNKFRDGSGSEFQRDEIFQIPSNDNSSSDSQRCK